MILRRLQIVNYKNIHEADLCFHSKLNCFVGLNGQGKTNVLDAIYLLSFTKSAFTTQDSLIITHGEDIALVKGEYSHSDSDPTALRSDSDNDLTTISCGLKKGVKKQFKKGAKTYTRLLEHIGLIPLVMVSPEDSHLIDEGSDERRRFMDSVISQQNKTYLDHLTRYNALLKQRNTLLKRMEAAMENGSISSDETALLEVFEQQMIPCAEYIYHTRTAFIEAFVPVFQTLYEAISGGAEKVSLRYVSQLQDRDLQEAFTRTRQRDLILGWTSQGIHKDEIMMSLEGHPLKQVGSQGQQKTYLLAMKLAQALYLSRSQSLPLSNEDVQNGVSDIGLAQNKPILLLDDIFDKLDSERVERIVHLVLSDQFGQIFITDTDRQHLTHILQQSQSQVFYVENGSIHTV